MKSIGVAAVAVAAFVGAASLQATAQDTISITRALALMLPPGYAETIVSPNPVEAALALGTWEAPEAGQTVEFPGGVRVAWREIAAGEGGWFTDSALARCYVFCTVECARERAALLEAMTNEMVYVNGAPRSGNPYGSQDSYADWETRFDYSRIPVVLRRGANELLFRCSRGRLRARLVAPPHPVMLNTRDLTMPDLLLDTALDSWGAVVVVNATDQELRGWQISFLPQGGKDVSAPVPPIAPMSVRKVPFAVVGRVPDRAGTRLGLLRLLDPHGVERDSASIPIRVVSPRENHKRTFFSDIDGSLQYCSVNPCSADNPSAPAALFLSLHGASVEAVNQSASYARKRWGHVVAPTNRRPYGFNWEEWGRLDALEVLALARRNLNIDSSRIYLTGHSMGGHGTWHIGSLFPDRFAAIAPSAGWISFWTYRFRGLNLGDSTPVRRMIRRATTPSETFTHATNYAQLGVYVLHGSDDDNVLVDQAHMMVDTLRRLGQDIVYHEQQGAGHWWDISDAPGADCTDWPGIFDFFARHRRPDRGEVREVRFVTCNPGVSPRDQWLTIDAQQRQLLPSRAHVVLDPDLRRFTGSTENVARLAFDTDMLPGGGPLTVVLDSQRIAEVPVPAGVDRVWFELADGRWRVAARPSADGKGAHRYGTFKDAFRNRMQFVYGTRGSEAENRWAFEKARYDAEKFWYQGNGSVDVVADADFDAAAEPDRNVILYGNAETNGAWKALLADSPVQVEDGELTVGSRRFAGKNLACLFVRPRKGSASACVAAVSGTGVRGMRATVRLPYMSPGIGLPDLTVISTDVLTTGDAGVRMTGFFGLDWSVERGEFVGKE